MSLANGKVSSNCTAMSDILSRIGDKWTVMVVGTLHAGPKRFSAIRRDIGGISQRMLTLTLRNLERDGLVNRTIYAQVPVRVEYELTPTGRTLLPAISALWDWSVANHSRIVDARARYDLAQVQEA